MMIIDSTPICPYTGLRSFTEEESLYFKGRDVQVDQITALLEQNKFLMVTGASGEGKSSLIFAGLIPNARAGFFKARYTNWIVADFRPERSPVANMARAVAEKLESKPQTVETELKRGFSSLADLYVNSPYYVDEGDPSWEQFNETEKRDKKRKAANLMILVDQFEEFFTNPENFYNEAPSHDAQIVVNLLLETSRIAIKRNLPIYIVCTMRSDYIGQCSAFRGLPEYIGFSQFFVPRLKRKDLKQVIEEPAILSGNRISQRLIERMIFDIAEGIDQLPILQHALSQVWLAADHGREEMDLLHYAMVGGMPADELPDEDQVRFRSWFEALPQYQQKYFQVTGLGKVIEIHANVLYENAWEYYNETHPEKPLSQKEAKRIIGLTFSCLTKIDNSRAVRNRMTLGEITEIIHQPELTSDVVGAVINIYREEGNSFIRPFKTEEDATHILSEDTVLDITHESLIRNWNKLNTWANQEFEFYSTYLDFKKQLDRWVTSGKSSGFLLPIGPLTYFEIWYNSCKPNPGWIRRYSEIGADKQKAIEQATTILSDIQEFIKHSSRKVMVTRAFMRYGPQRIATTLAIVVLIALSSFYWYNAEQKKNERVLKVLKQQAEPLLKSPEVGFDSKANYMLTLERSSPGSLIPYLEAAESKDRISLAIFTYKRLLEFDKHHKGALMEELIRLIIHSLNEYDSEKDPDFLLTERNRFMVHLAYDEYYNPDTEKKKTLMEQAQLNKDLVLKFYRNTAYNKSTVPVELNLAIQYWLTFGKLEPDDLNELIGVISPLESGTSTAFNAYYPAGSYEPNGRDRHNFNGGYHTLASLYASRGDAEMVIRCFDKILETGQRSYFEVPRLFNNHINIIGYFYLSGHRSRVPQVVEWITNHTTDNPPQTVYRNVAIRSGVLTSFYVVNIFKQTRSYRGYFNVNLSLAPEPVVDAIFEDYEKTLTRDVKDVSERNFWIAMNYKRRAMFLSKNHFDRILPLRKEKTDSLFAKALYYYQQVDEKTLTTSHTITIPYFGDGVRTRTLSLRELFLYPDYMDGWFARPFNTDAFFEYLDRNKLLSELYQRREDLAMIHFWVARAFEEWPGGSRTYTNNYPVGDTILQSILHFVDNAPEGKSFDKNLLNLVLANRKFQQGDTTLAIRYYREFDQSTIRNSSERYEYIEKTFFLNEMKYLVANLALVGKHVEATQLTELFDKDEQRIYAYILMTEKLYRNKLDPQSFVYLDSVLSISKRINFNTAQLDSRIDILLLLTRLGGERLNNLALQILKDMPQNQKTNAIEDMVMGISEEGNYYRALTSIPPTLTEDADLFSRTLILMSDCRQKDALTGDDSWRAMDEFIDWLYYYTFFLPN